MQVAVEDVPVPPEAPNMTPSVTPARAVTNHESGIGEDPTPGPSRVKKAAKRDTSPQAASLLKAASECKPKVAKPNERATPKKRPQGRPGQ